GSVIALVTLAPMISAALLCAGALLGLGVPLDRTSLGRDVLVLMACAASSAPLSIEALAPRHGGVAGRMIAEITRLDDVTSLAILGVVAVLFRQNDALTS